MVGSKAGPKNLVASRDVYASLVHVCIIGVCRELCSNIILWCMYASFVHVWVAFADNIAVSELSGLRKALISW